MEEQRISPQEYEKVFEKLWHHAQHQPYAVKTTEAPHYRRYVLQHGGDPLAGPQGSDDGAARRGHRAPLGVGDGKGVMFVSHNGEIYPAGFLPLCCGRFPNDSVVDVYQNHPIFQALRDPDRFKGRCGVCEYRHVCGGSRARAYAVTGDYPRDRTGLRLCAERMEGDQIAADRQLRLKSKPIKGHVNMQNSECRSLSICILQFALPFAI